MTEGAARVRNDEGEQARVRNDDGGMTNRKTFTIRKIGADGTIGPVYESDMQIQFLINRLGGPVNAAVIITR